ncbi:hypothetical protein ACET3Z_009305 [Daucus carota]
MFSLKTNGDNGTHFQNLKISETDRSNERFGSRRPVEADHLLLKFIWAHNNLVDREVLAKLNIGDKSATEEALNQIHFRSLGIPNTKVAPLNEKTFSSKSYREALLNPRAQREVSEGSEEGEWQEVSYKKKRSVKGGGRKQTTVAKEDQASESSEKGEQKLEVVEGDIEKALDPRQEEHISNEQQGGDEVWGSDPCLRIKQHPDTSVSLSSNKVGEMQVNNFKNIRQESTSSGVYSERSQKMVEYEKSEAYVPALNASSQSTLCSGIVKKLRVKSRRGRPKKANLLQKNPFEIGVKFKVKGGKRSKSKASQGSKKRNNFNNNLQLVPVNVIGRNVREALAILESAENMGLVCNEDRDEVIKEIVRRLDSKEL